MKPLRAFIALVLFFGTVAAFASDQRRIRVLTSFLPVYSLTANIAGDYADVDSLSTINASPHDFQFSPSDNQKVQGADLSSLKGLALELEGRLEPLLKAGRKTSHKVEMSAGLKPF